MSKSKYRFQDASQNIHDPGEKMGNAVKTNTIKRFVSFYKPYKRSLFFDLMCATIVSGVGLVFPMIIQKLTTNVFLLEDLNLMLRLLLQYAGILLFLYIIEALAQYYMTSYGHIMGAKMETDMRRTLFNHMEGLSFSFYDKTDTGNLMSRLINDLFDVSELAHHGPEDIFISLVKLVGSFVILFSIHVPTTLILLATTALMIYFTYKQNRRMQQTFMENRRRIAEVNSIVQDSLSGIRTVQSYSNERIEEEKFQDGNLRFLESKRQNYMVMGQFHSTVGFLQGMMYLSVLIVGGFYIINGQMPAASLITYVLYINMFLDPVRRLVNFTEQFQRGMTGFQRMIEVLDVIPEVKDRPNAKDAGVLEGNISFHNVSFHYTEEEPVLNNISIDIPKQTTVALVGPSGAGKTTFCSLIPRFYDVMSGSLTIDGVDVRDMTLRSLRENIGVVQQDVYIFNSTVRENIAFGKSDATDEEIEQAAKMANIHDFIMSLPDGYDTEMGDRGVRFSGGQKQRISIARVFLKNPPILILDEATSSLDNESELFIQESLNNLSRNRTTLVIAHRLSTIRDADEILTMTEEGIVERGTHEELMTADGLYASLYRLQFSTQQETES